ncbi:MAG TPA: hypothetical protein VFR41_14930 [Acidimicrobiia bacterium]|nr:hypothetical protein [Acidimicrobiia bacterium]
MITGLHVGLVLTALAFGFRHGIDWDHIAALTDLTSGEQRPRRSMMLASVYAAGHAAVVFTLGVAAIVFAARLPVAIDHVMERVVGVTLLVLGGWVLMSLVRRGRDFRMRSRWMLLGSAVPSAMARVRRHEPVVTIEHEHEHDATALHEYALTGAQHAGSHGGSHSHHHRHVGALPDDPFAAPSRRTAFVIGALHGIGAETPTQVVLFVTAAGVVGKGGGVALLLAFIVGLVASNTVIALAGTFGALHATRRFRWYATISTLTAIFSLVVGALFVFGAATSLPALLGG